MSESGLFIVGVLVTLIVVAAVAPLVYAAILDGRQPAPERERRVDTQLEQVRT